MNTLIGSILATGDQRLKCWTCSKNWRKEYKVWSGQKWCWGPKDLWSGGTKKGKWKSEFCESGKCFKVIPGRNKYEGTIYNV